jgi:hypothetical protein
MDSHLQSAQQFLAQTGGGGNVGLCLRYWFTCSAEYLVYYGYKHQRKSGNMQGCVVSYFVAFFVVLQSFWLEINFGLEKD